MKTWMIVIYYVLIAVFLLLLEKKKKKSLLINSLFIFLSLTILYFKNYINPYQKVTFLNVYQGDCIIIQDSFSDDVMLIDTGGLLNYDIASKKIIPYLQYNGIKNIDIVVITHDDFDHNGALNQLVSLIDVEQIITDNNFESIDFGKIQLININSFYDETSDKNDTSIVLYGNIGGYDFLFAADISSKIEKKIINKYETLNVDILKVAHHGSKSSTCNEFILHTSPEYGIISVGENNYYGHPNENVIETLTNNNVIVYRTDQDGTIRFIIKNDKTLFVETAK